MICSVYYFDFTIRIVLTASLLIIINGIVVVSVVTMLTMTRIVDIIAKKRRRIIDMVIIVIKIEVVVRYMVMISTKNLNSFRIGTDCTIC